MRGEKLAPQIAIELGLYLADEAEEFVAMVDSTILPEDGFDLPGWPDRAAAIKNSVDLFRDRAARAIARRAGVTIREMLEKSPPQ